MRQSLGKSAQSVQDALINAGLQCKVLDLPETTRTASDAAKSIGCNLSQIVKSLIFKTKKTEKPVLVLTSGPNRVNESQLKLYVGEKITKADATFTKKITGFAIGGIPPVGHKTPIDLIYIDQDLLTQREVWAAAGTPNAVFCIKSEDLLNITKGTPVSIKNP